MKKVILTIIITIQTISFVWAQNADTPPETPGYTMANYKGKTFIFDGNVLITECDTAGKAITPTKTVIAYQGSLFSVIAIDKQTGTMTIKFLIWKLKEPKQSNNDDKKRKYSSQLANRRKYNFNTDAGSLIPIQDRAPEDFRYFILTQKDKTTSVSEYLKGQNWNIAFGTFTWPFKFRPTKSAWKDNVSLGATVSAQYKFSKDWAIGGLFGFSLSSVSLDSASTAGYTKTSTDRPAYSPSLSVLLSYKNVNITFGGGIDWINRPTPLEQSWIFHGKPWLGLGIGINLFTNKSTEGSTTKASDDQ